MLGSSCRIFVIFLLLLFVLLLEILAFLAFSLLFLDFELNISNGGSISFESSFIGLDLRSRRFFDGVDLVFFLLAIAYFETSFSTVKGIPVFSIRSSNL